MPHLTLSIDADHSAGLTLHVGVGRQRRAAFESANTASPSLIPVPAIIDNLILGTVSVAAADMTGTNTKALIGLDVLNGRLFSYDGLAKTFTFAF
jgi:hypothetical protein